MFSAWRAFLCKAIARGNCRSLGEQEACSARGVLPGRKSDKMRHDGRDLESINHDSLGRNGTKDMDNATETPRSFCRRWPCEQRQPRSRYTSTTPETKPNENNVSAEPRPRPGCCQRRSRVNEQATSVLIRLSTRCYNDSDPPFRAREDLQAGRVSSAPR